MASWTNPIDYNVGQATCVQRFDERILDNIDFAGSHAHSGAAGDGGALSGCVVTGSNAAMSVLQYVTVVPFLPACRLAGDGFSIDATALGNGNYLLSNTAPTVVGASVQWLVDLDKGTWSFSMYHGKRNDAGIISVCVGGTFAGCVDTYVNNATLQRNFQSAASTFSIAASGPKVLRLIVTACNAAPSLGYRGWINHIELRRLSA